MTDIAADAQAIQHVICLINQALDRKKKDLAYAGSFSGSEMIHSLYVAQIWLEVEQNYALEAEVKYRKQVLKQEIEPVFEA